MLRESLKHFYQIWWLKCVGFTCEMEIQGERVGVDSQVLPMGGCLAHSLD